MIPLITQEIPENFYEKIRDQLAAILLNELPNQGVLKGDQELQNLDKIYIERSAPFSKENLPAFNVLVNEVDFHTETQISKQFSAEYFIDVYASMPANPTGRADERTNKRLQTLAGLVDGIISNGLYVGLGFPTATTGTNESIFNRAVGKVQYFNPEDVKDTESITRARITVLVTANQPKVAVDPTQLNELLVDMCLYSPTGQYFYRILEETDE